MSQLLAAQFAPVSAWSTLAVSRVLLRLLVVAFVPTGPLVVGIDETLELVGV